MIETFQLQFESNYIMHLLNPYTEKDEKHKCNGLK